MCVYTCKILFLFDCLSLCLKSQLFCVHIFEKTLNKESNKTNQYLVLVSHLQFISEYPLFFICLFGSLSVI